LNLGRVLALVAAGNPDLMASSAGVAAVAARSIDAGKLANPEGGILFEDFSGQHPANAQTTLQLLGEINELTSSEESSAWARRILAAKNTLTRHASPRSATATRAMTVVCGTPRDADRSVGGLSGSYPLVIGISS